MAPTPTTIPTSFVPKQPVRAGASFTKSGGNTFLTLALVILALALLACAGVFGYERYLLGVRDAKSAAVTKAEEDIDSATVEEFIRTRDRFASAEGLLDSHVASSGFFEALEALTLQTVRFSSLSFTLASDRSAQISMDGTARTFNALAAQSSAFAGEKRIKRAIFSGIKVNPGGTVSFSLDADLDPSLLTFSAAAAPAVEEPVLPAATTTPATGTTTAPLP